MRAFRFLTIMRVITPFIAYSLVSCDTRSTSGMPSNVTHGEIFETRVGKFYTGKSVQSYHNLTSARCIMVFSYQSEVLSMNVIGKDYSTVTCHMFERKSIDMDEEDEGLIELENSTNYEKNSLIGYVKASQPMMVVESKDDKPATFYFEQPTGFYKVKLNHVRGSLACESMLPPTHFGCEWDSGYHPVYISLVKGFRGNVIFDDRLNFEFDADWRKTSYVATSGCFELIQRDMYSIWYTGDFINHTEPDNSGKTTFELFVKPCHY